MKWYKLIPARFDEGVKTGYSYYSVEGTTIVFKFSRDWVFQQLVPSNRTNCKIVPQSYLNKGILEVFYCIGDIINIPINRVSNYYSGIFDILYINNKKLEELTKICNRKQTVIKTTLYNYTYSGIFYA